MSANSQLLSREQVMRLISLLDGPERLVAALVYVTGLRVADCLQLRVRDLGDCCLYLHDRWGIMRRIVMLPAEVAVPLELYVEGCAEQYATDRAAGASVPVPGGLCEGDDPATSWRWRFVFAATEFSLDRDGRPQRLARTPQAFRSAFARAARAAALPGRFTPQALRDAHGAHEVELATGVALNSRSVAGYRFARDNNVTSLTARRAAEATCAGFDNLGLLLVRGLQSVQVEGRLA